MTKKSIKPGILILGGGVSGLGAAALAHSLGYWTRVSDSKTLSAEQLARFKRLNAEVFTGGHHLDQLENIGKIILSPGISSNSDLLNHARSQKIEILSEIDFAFHGYKGQIISVTGTNGKSTVCAMLKHIFDTLKIPADLAGNFGTPPSAIRATRTLHPIVILELSSYQLEQTFFLKNTVGIFTSLSHDHLTRHGSFADYFAAKWKLAAFTQTLFLITKNVEKELKNSISPPCVIKTVELSQDFTDASGQTEQHNMLNAKLASFAAAEILKKPPLELAVFLKNFRGLPHRCQKVGFFRQHQLIDDSKSTNVESTLAALENPSSSSVILMLGGVGKGESYAPILKFKDKISQVVIFGQSGPDIFKDLKIELQTHVFKTCKEACDFIKSSTLSPFADILFSPACASFDEFKNFEERGLFFQRAFLP